MYVLNRHYELEIAFVAGLDNSIGDYVITLNPQTDPVALIPEFFGHTMGGSEFVCGIMRDGHLKPAYNYVSRQFSKALRSTTAYRCQWARQDFRVYSCNVAGFINQNTDRHILLKILPFMATTQISTVAYDAVTPSGGRRKRRNLPISILSGIPVLLASSATPLRLLTSMTLTVSMLSLAYVVYVVVVALLKHNIVEGWLSLALPMAVMFFFISTILGILAEYVFRLAQHSRNSPMYVFSGENLSTANDLQKKLNVIESSGNYVDRQ